MLSFGDYYLQNPISQLSWNSYPASCNVANNYCLPSVFTTRLPNFDLGDLSLYTYTPPTNFGYIPPIQIYSGGYNPFGFLDLITKNTTGTNGYRPFPLDDPIPYQTYFEISNNPFAFLDTRINNNGIYATNPFGYLDTKSTSNIRTRKVGNRVAQEILPGKEILTIGKGINLTSLKRDMKVKLVQLSEKAKTMGYTLVVSDAFRTQEQQIAAKQNKPELAATPGKSPHEYGAGIDIALYDKNGKQVNIATVPEFSDYAKSIGLEWGNDWKSKKEPWHFQLANWQTRSDIGPEYRKRNSSIA